MDTIKIYGNGHTVHMLLVFLIPHVMWHRGGLILMSGTSRVPNPSLAIIVSPQSQTHKYIQTIKIK